MRLRITRNDFFDGLKKIQNIVEKRQTMPILSNFLLEAGREGEIDITATDLELVFQGSFPAEIEEFGRVTLSTRKSFDILRELPSDALVSLEVEESSGGPSPSLMVRLKAGKSMFRLAALPGGDYPAVEEPAHSQAFEVEAECLKDMVVKTIFATSTEDSRQAVGGALMSLSEDSTVQLVATDGHRLAVVKREVKMVSPERLKAVGEEGLSGPSAAEIDAMGGIWPQVILPRRAMVELRRVMEGNPGQEPGVEDLEAEAGVEGSPSPERVEVGMYEGGAIFRKGKVRLTIRALEGPYPEYDYVVPESCSKVVQVDRMLFSQALRRVSLLSDEKFKPIILKIGREEMEVVSNTPEMGEAREQVPVLLQGEEIEVGFNARYLLDVCAVTAGQFLAMEMTNAVGAVVLRPWEETGYFCVVMPMRLG